MHYATHKEAYHQKVVNRKLGWKETFLWAQQGTITHFKKKHHTSTHLRASNFRFSLCDAAKLLVSSFWAWAASAAVTVAEAPPLIREALAACEAAGLDVCKRTLLDAGPSCDRGGGGRTVWGTGTLFWICVAVTILAFCWARTELPGGVIVCGRVNREAPWNDLGCFNAAFVWIGNMKDGLDMKASMQAWIIFFSFFWIYTNRYMHMIKLRKKCMLKFPTYPFFKTLFFSHPYHYFLQKLQTWWQIKDKYKMHAAMELLKLFGKTITLLDDRLTCDDLFYIHYTCTLVQRLISRWALSASLWQL